MATITQILLNAMVAGAGHGLMAMSFAIIYNTTHFFHFAHGAVYVMAAYVAFALLAVVGLNPAVAVLGAVAAAAVLGGLMELSVYRPLRRREAGPIVLLLASLGLLIVLQNLISLIFGDAIRSMPGADVREGLAILGARITPVQLSTVVISTGLFVGVALGLRYTRAGRTLRAIANDEELARVVGVDAARTILLAFVVGSALAGVAAVLAAYDTGIRPTIGFNALLIAVVAVVIGGVGSISGAFLGGLTIGLVQQIGAWVLPSKWQDTIVFVILILFLIARPHGLFGKPLRTAAV